MVNSWEKVKTFDNTILPEERKIIRELEEKFKKKCPHLQKEGNYFYYCALNIPEIRDKMPRPNHPVYQRHLSVMELPMYCMDAFETCCYNTGKLKR